MANLDLYHAIIAGKTAWCELNHNPTAFVKGSDALRYLNGQVTNDVKSLTCGKSILAAVLNAKGKFVGELWIKRNPNGSLFFDSPESCFQSVVQRLEMYIIADDVSIDPNPALHGYYLWSNSPPPPIPDAEVYESKRWGIKGWEIWSTEPLNFSDLPKVNEETIEIFRIENTVPNWGTDFDQTYLPQEASWSEHHGLHFAKGCYVGQEIVSRLRNVGHVNREIKLISCIDATPNDDLRSLRGESLLYDNREIATITSITFSPKFQSWIALATLPRPAWQQVLKVKNWSWQCLHA